MTVTGKTASPSLREQKERRKRFRAALALAGIDAQDFAVQADVTPAHLSQVLHGKRESQTLTEKVDRFTEKHLGQVAV